MYLSNASSFNSAALIEASNPPCEPTSLTLPIKVSGFAIEFIFSAKDTVSEPSFNVFVLLSISANLPSPAANLFTPIFNASGAAANIPDLNESFKDASSSESPLVTAEAKNFLLKPANPCPPGIKPAAI